MNYWLVKSEPESYSWETFVKEGKAAWTGVRNFSARLNLRAMKKGDLVFFYHSVTGKQIVGIARVAKEFYPDPTGSAAVPAAKGRVPRPSDDWSCVDLVPVKALAQPVSLETIKKDETLCDMRLLKQSRLSVTPLKELEFQRIIKLSGTKI